MEWQDGTEFAQNYDVIVKWFIAALQGETLEVPGIKSGRIEEAFGFEPVEITVTTGRVDVIARDETGALYHIEEQRNLQKSDLYRFAAYHFLAAKQWKSKLTNVILASGDVFKGEKTLRTESGTYTPVVIDFTQKDGHQRLAEIKQAIQAGTGENLLELMFLPLYGQEAGNARSAFVEEVLHLESELYISGKLPARLLVATLIMSNKLIDKARLHEIWEEIKMLDILEIAREEGVKEGKSLGLKEGEMMALRALQEVLIDALMETFPILPADLLKHIRSIDDLDVIKGLHRHAIKCTDLQEFEQILQQAT